MLGFCRLLALLSQMRGNNQHRQYHHGEGKADAGVELIGDPKGLFILVGNIQIERSDDHEITNPQSVQLSPHPAR